MESNKRVGCGCIVPLALLLLGVGGVGAIGIVSTAKDAYGISLTNRHPVSKDSLTFGAAIGPEDIADESLEPYAREVSSLVGSREEGLNSPPKTNNPYKTNGAVLRFKDREIILFLEIAKRPDFPDTDFSAKHTRMAS